MHAIWAGCLPKQLLQLHGQSLPSRHYAAFRFLHLNLAPFTITTFSLNGMAILDSESSTVDNRNCAF